MSPGSRWIGYAKLLLSVCVCVRAWCLETDWYPYLGEFSCLFVRHDPYHDPDEAAFTDDEWIWTWTEEELKESKYRALNDVTLIIHLCAQVWQNSHSSLSSFSHSDRAVMTSPGYAIPALGKRNPMHPACSARRLEHHLTEWHLGAPCGWSGLLLHLLDIGWENPADQVHRMYTWAGIKSDTAISKAVQCYYTV